MTVHTGQRRGDTFAGHADLKVEVCGSCGVLFAAPTYMLEICRETGREFFCPNGHSLVYGRVEIWELRKSISDLRDQVAAEKACHDQTEASLRATKGVVTKQRTKLELLSKGVCPCCNRSFSDLRKHMKTKHPDYNGQPQ